MLCWQQPHLLWQQHHAAAAVAAAAAAAAVLALHRAWRKPCPAPEAILRQVQQQQWPRRQMFMQF
jgi:hypothetical protein